MQTASPRSQTTTLARPPYRPANRPPAPAVAVERRIAARIPAALVPLVTGVRLSPCGGNASLVNISASGAAVKSDIRLTLETVVTLKLEGALSVPPISGRVSRCGVAAIESGVVWYHIGIAFDEPISIEEATANRPAAVQPVTAAPQQPAPEARATLFNRW